MPKRIKCKRCQGLFVGERVLTPQGQKLEILRCLNCGHIIDEQILHNLYHLPKEYKEVVTVERYGKWNPRPRRKKQFSEFEESFVHICTNDSSEGVCTICHELQANVSMITSTKI